MFFRKSSEKTSSSEYPLRVRYSYVRCHTFWIRKYWMHIISVLLLSVSLILSRTSFLRQQLPVLTQTITTTMKQQNVGSPESTRATPQMEIPFTVEYHKPPTSHNNNTDNDDNDYYNDNPTPFGEILRGQGRARILAETNDLLAFVDRTPHSKTLHALIIPKRFIPTIVELEPTPDTIQLLYDMEQLGQELLQRYQCCNHQNDYRMVFHVPPYPFAFARVLQSRSLHVWTDGQVRVRYTLVHFHIHTCTATETTTTTTTKVIEATNTIYKKILVLVSKTVRIVSFHVYRVSFRWSSRVPNMFHIIHWTHTTLLTKTSTDAKWR